MSGEIIIIGAGDDGLQAGQAAQPVAGGTLSHEVKWRPSSNLTDEQVGQRVALITKTMRKLKEKVEGPGSQNLES